MTKSGRRRPGRARIAAVTKQREQQWPRGVWSMLRKYEEERIRSGSRTTKSLKKAKMGRWGPGRAYAAAMTKRREQRQPRGVQSMLRKCEAEWRRAGSRTTKSLKKRKREDGEVAVER
jgi:hypothetical protein